MKAKYSFGVFLILFFVFGLSVTVYAENIDPDEDGSQYCYGENIGWVNFEPSCSDPQAGAQVGGDKVVGFVWAENIGWINLFPSNYGGVYNDGAGNLSGYAWSENVGWINFDPVVAGDSTDYGVKIDSEGNFSGWAWGENVGWLNFNSGDLYGQGVKVCKVNYYDLANFSGQWLFDGPGWSADLSSDEDVDFQDYSIFSSYWGGYCPAEWQLK